MTKEEILALAKNTGPIASDEYCTGIVVENMRLMPIIEALVESREELREALEKIKNLLVEDECEECANFTAIRYEIKPARHAFLFYTKQEMAANIINAITT